MRVEEAITSRSSTRGYTKEEVKEEDLQKILEAGLKAPTAVNRQEIHFTVVKGNDPALKKLDEEKNRLRGQSNLPHNFYYEAPVLILLSADKSFHWNEVDAGIAVENMSLTAEELGLGSLIIGSVYDVFRGENREEFERLFAFPEGYEYEIALAVGYKAVEKEPHTYEQERRVTFL